MIVITCYCRRNWLIALVEITSIKCNASRASNAFRHIEHVLLSHSLSPSAHPVWTWRNTNVTATVALAVGKAVSRLSGSCVVCGFAMRPVYKQDYEPSWQERACNARAWFFIYCLNYRYNNKLNFDRCNFVQILADYNFSCFQIDR